MKAYTVEMDHHGCAHCGRGRTWVVIDPKGLAGGVSYGDAEDAEEVASQLNDAVKMTKELHGI